MLSDDEERAIHKLLNHYPDKRAASLEALKVVQNRKGWVNDQDLREIAELLEMTAEELEGVATYYSLIYRQPVGRHVILLCDSVACWIGDCGSLRRQMQQRLGVGFGETSEDGRFTLLPICCIGACNLAPAMLIDGNLHGNVATKDLDSILDEYQ